MEFFNPKNAHINFVKLFSKTNIISTLLTLAGLVAAFYPGLNYGIDFRGGVEARVTFTAANVNQGELRELLSSRLKNLSIVDFKGVGKSEFLITAQAENADAVGKILSDALASKYGPQGQAWNAPHMDVVGPKAGADLRKAAAYSLFYACFLIALYMYWRFDMRYTWGVLACIGHDLLVTTGFLVLTGREFSTTIVAALLTLAGYSVNDTVVVFDRIRELEKRHPGRSKGDVVNEAINSTLSRTILTSSTTLVTCAVLYFVGGPALEDFALTLFFGVFVGTYSSAFVAAPLYIWADRKFSAPKTGVVAHAKG